MTQFNWGHAVNFEEFFGDGGGDICYCMQLNCLSSEDNFASQFMLVSFWDLSISGKRSPWHKFDPCSDYSKFTSTLVRTLPSLQEGQNVL